MEVPPPIRRTMPSYQDMVKMYIKHAAVSVALFWSQLRNHHTVLFIHLDTYARPEENDAILSDVLSIMSSGRCASWFTPEQELFLAAHLIPHHLLAQGIKRLDRFNQEFAKFFSRVRQNVHFVLSIDINGMFFIYFSPNCEFIISLH